MKKIMLLLFVTEIVTGIAKAGGMDDDPLLGMLLVDQFELQSQGPDNSLAWDAEGWIGKDLNKLWIKTDGEYRDSVEEIEVQALYSRAIAPFWDIQAGWRRGFLPEPNQDWLVLGFKGLAPYYFDIDATIFLADSGQSSAKFQLEYEFMFTQRLILVPELELNFYGKDEPEKKLGSGLSNIESGLRLRYEIRRELAPYIGMSTSRLYGQTAYYESKDAESLNPFRFVTGVRFWL